MQTPVTTVVIKMTSRTNGTMIAILPVSHKKKPEAKATIKSISPGVYAGGTGNY